MPKQFSDISFWQGRVNFDVMRQKSDMVIIRAGQNVWVDREFNRNWTEAKRVGMMRGAYWFWDDRIDPGRQAALFTSLLRNDPPELGAWVDYERSFGGQHGGLKNAVAFMQEIERLLPNVEVGFYTGYFYMVETSNLIFNAAQYSYLAKKNLWLAWYGSNPKIPAPWSRMKYHQIGTPAWGREWGCVSEEIDINEDMAGDPPPVPPLDENGETMHGTVTTFTNIRADRNRNSADLGDLLAGDKVEFHDEVWAGIDGLNYRRLINATRNGVPVHRSDGAQWGTVDAYAYSVNIRVDTPPAPPPPAPAFDLQIDKVEMIVHATRLSDGTKWKAMYTQAGLNLSFERVE